jgi:hypothetical protein
MSQTIELPQSKMQVRFRVMARRTRDDAEIMISSWSDYVSAELACWQYPGKNAAYELYIEKVWIAKGINEQ